MHVGEPRPSLSRSPLPAVPGKWKRSCCPGHMQGNVLVESLMLWCLTRQNVVTSALYGSRQPPAQHTQMLETRRRLSPLLCRREPGTHSSTKVSGQAGDGQQNVGDEKLLRAVRCYAELYLFMPTWAMVWDKRNKEDEIQHPRMPQGGTKDTEMRQQLRRVFFCTQLGFAAWM